MAVNALTQVVSREADKDFYYPAVNECLEAKQQEVLRHTFQMVNWEDKKRDRITNIMQKAHSPS